MPEYQAPPVQAAAPAPTILPSEVSAQNAEDNRRKQVERLRSGIASTIKTSPRGILGTSPELQPGSTGKQKLGA